MGWIGVQVVIEYTYKLVRPRGRCFWSICDWFPFFLVFCRTSLSLQGVQSSRASSAGFVVLVFQAPALEWSSTRRVRRCESERIIWHPEIQGVCRAVYTAIVTSVTFCSTAPVLQQGIVVLSLRATSTGVPADLASRLQPCHLRLRGTHGSPRLAEPASRTEC